MAVIGFIIQAPGFTQRSWLTLKMVSNMKEAGSPMQVRMRPRFSSIHRMKRFFNVESPISGNLGQV
jgi:hypothetical protein